LQFDGGAMNRTSDDVEHRPIKWVLWSLIGALLLLGAVVGGIWLYNESDLDKPLHRVLVADPRNHVVQAGAHFDGWVDTETVVFDLNDVSGDASNLDVFRVLLQFAQALKDQRYAKVILSAYGQKKFSIPGAYFQFLGREFATQNPVYTIRTFPNHVAAMDGSQPFPEVTGGIFYVLPKEMEDFKAFNQRWYVDDFVMRHK
jgi:hypothetical protein